MEDLKNGDYRHMETILGNMLYDILKKDVEASPTLPDELLLETKTFDFISILQLDNIDFIRLPDGLVTDESTDHTNFFSYLEQYKTMKKSDAEELLTLAKKRIMLYKLQNKERGPFRIVWIPEEVSSKIKIMRTQIQHLSKPSFIYSMGVVIPINVDVRLQQLFFQQMIDLLFKTVPFDRKNGDVSKLKFGYYIRNEITLYLFISHLG